MADIAENLRSFLLADGTIAGLLGTPARLHQNTVPQEDVYPYGWFALSDGEDLEEVLNPAVGETPFKYAFDFEAVGDDAAYDLTIALKAAVRARLHNYRGAFGTQNVQCVFARDQGEDYIARNNSGDEGVHAESLRVEIIPR